MKISIFLSYITGILQQPAILLGLFAFVGLVALKNPWYKVLTGSLGPIIGFLMIGAGADFIVANLIPLGLMIEHGFNITGVVPNNEVIVSLAISKLGYETMWILLFGLIINIIIARFTKYKYVFLSGHHSFYMACLLCAVLGVSGFSGIELVFFGSFFLGAWSVISPAIGQRYTIKVTGEGENIAMGHFSSLGYYLSAFIASLIGKNSPKTEDIKLPEQYSWLRNTTISTALVMFIVYMFAAFVAGSDYVSTISGGVEPYLFAGLAGLKFAVGVTIVYSGVRLILADLIPAFQGISLKVIPNAIPAVDCSVFFTFAPTALIIGFISSFFGGLVAMFLLGLTGFAIILPALVAHFFTGGTAGIYGNATGGRLGAIVGSFVNGVIITVGSAFLLPVLSKLGFYNTTFSDSDYSAIGIFLGNGIYLSGSTFVYVVSFIILLILIVPNFLKSKNKVINNPEE